ncbi:MAG: HD domain-containing protein [Candidatus Thiodiazotropha sp. (ex Dulcina madagascariensis)]|nr:HD domain-containing protein [Candidatus Thiodiazotropha sp. (ex Dulcina madagascariensis)]MCU7926429.1 HD domain-containing protein [Candidatus Thiodiazotropha sp. (ex Dulcina madagascariensis)]
MAIRIKSQWHDEDASRSPDEIGGAIAFIAWRIALNKAITLHGKHFVYQDDNQRLAVIAEYLAYQAQIADRLIHDMVDSETRDAIITALVMKLADHYRDNAADLLGPGDHADRFIALFNERSGEYAEFNFDDAGPSYPFLRHLGFEIQQVMGSETQQNRWVIDQVMDVDGPEVYKQLARAVRNLFD